MPDSLFHTSGKARNEPDDRRDEDTCEDIHEESHAWYERLTADLIHTAGAMNKLEARFIALVDEYDEYELWRVGSPGIKNFPNWLNVHCGLNLLVAREKIRVARCLRKLPGITQAFTEGGVSYSKVRALTRVATPENEALLLEDARSMTAAQLEQRVRRFRRVEVPDPYLEDDESENVTHSSVKCWRDEEGDFHLHARLPGEDGAVLENAIERMVNTASSEEPSPLPSSYVLEEIESGQRRNAASRGENVSAETFFGGQRARALVGIAEHFMATAQDGAECRAGSDRNHVVLHINANAAHRDCRINGGACTFLDKGEFVAPAVAERLACDASLTTVLEDDAGNVLNIGRRSRIVTRAIDLAVDVRDNFTCQHPWCHQTRHTQKHHIEHWATGGETSVKNLITLCRRHHSLTHEGNFHIERIDNADGTYHFTFIDAQGEIISAVPADPGPPADDPRAREAPVPIERRDLSSILGREVSAFERRIDRNLQTLAALRKLYSVREPAAVYSPPA